MRPRFHRLARFLITLTLLLTGHVCQAQNLKVAYFRDTRARVIKVVKINNGLFARLNKPGEIYRKAKRLENGDLIVSTKSRHPNSHCVLIHIKANARRIGRKPPPPSKKARSLLICRTQQLKKKQNRKDKSPIGPPPTRKRTSKPQPSTQKAKQKHAPKTPDARERLRKLVGLPTSKTTNTKSTSAS